MDKRERFIRLVEEHHGFEIVHGFRDFEDHYLGGTGERYWYFIDRKGKADAYAAVCHDGRWTDRHITGKGKKMKVTEAEAGTTISLIAEEAFCGAEKTEGRKGKRMEGSHPYLHFVFGFGEKAVDISEEYGVTIGYSDINNNEQSFRLRDILVGKEVSPCEGIT